MHALHTSTIFFDDVEFDDEFDVVDRRHGDRFEARATVEIAMGAHISITTSLIDRSPGGVGVRLPGGASLGERYLVIFQPHGSRPRGRAAQVAWVGRFESDGHARVGLAFVD